MTQEPSKKTWAVWKQTVPGKDKWEKVKGGFEAIELAERYFQQCFALHGSVVQYRQEEG